MQGDRSPGTVEFPGFPDSFPASSRQSYPCCVSGCLYF